MHEIKPKRMLVVLAHPDDESFAVGGTLAKYADQDVQIVLLSATCGEAGIPGVTAEAACAIRERELKQAAGHLGIEPFFLGFPDGGLVQTMPESIMEAVACWMDQVQPQVILTFGSDGVSGHSDHITISDIVTRVYDRCYKKGLLLYIRPSAATVLGCGVSDLNSDDARPLVEVDICNYRLQKVMAIQSHVSQDPGLPGRPEEEMEKIPCSELFTLARENTFQDQPVDWFERPIERAVGSASRVSSGYK